MSDWQVGDLAVCVELDDIHPVWRKQCALKVGESYRVAALHTSPWNGSVLLDLGWPNHAFQYFHPAAWRFRKIRPDEHEACEPKFVTLLKRTKVHT